MIANRIAKVITASATAMSGEATAIDGRTFGALFKHQLHA